MKDREIKLVWFVEPVVFVLFFLVYYLVDLPFEGIDTIFITITIFLFATLVGFFISRQSARYASIISKVTDFDGNASYLYRSSSVFGEEAQKEMGEILKEHYRALLENSSWDFYFTRKTNTLTNINTFVDKHASVGNLNPAQSAFASRAYFGLGEMQKIRKNLIALYKERVPFFQWVLLSILSVILILAVSSMNSFETIIPSLVKALFSASIIAVIIMLYKLNNLTFYENSVGSSSAQDVLNIIEGVR